SFRFVKIAAISPVSREEVLVRPALRRWNQPCFFGGSACAADASGAAGAGSSREAADGSASAGGAVEAGSGRRNSPNRPREDLAGVSLTVHTWELWPRPAIAGPSSR